MTTDEEQQFVSAAVGGNVAALQRLLLHHRPALVTYLERQFPQRLRRTLEPNDLLQDTYFEAVRSISSFVPEGDNSFCRWLITIARHQILQLLRAHNTLKRGQGHTRGDSMAVLLEDLARHEHTPSRSAAGHELALELEAGIQRLPDDYRDAIRMRHVDRLEVKEIAAQMQRSERAVHMLCNRGLKLLRHEMRSLSRFL